MRGAGSGRSRRTRPRFPACFLCLVALALTGALAGAAEKDPPSSPTGRAPASGAPPRPRRQAPETMVLCRGPRGVVYARDVAVGCRNVELDTTNLAAFGAGPACVLRSASALDPGAKGAASGRNCDQVCKAVEDGRSCVVALQRVSGAWQTVAATHELGAGDAGSGDTVAVCCR